MVLIKKEGNMLIHIKEHVMIWYKMNEIMDNGYICGSSNMISDKDIQFQKNNGYVEF